MAFLGFLSGTGLLGAAGLGFAGAFGFPRWLLSFLRKRREAKFIDGLADAVDIIVRGVKAGLPLGDCIRMITMESSEPLKTEFRLIMETQAIGMPLGEACGKLYERTPLPEANFFGIVVAIQQKAGGNLSEALGNLSKVLRDRKKMRAKIQAMSQEAKASAAIIGCAADCRDDPGLPHQPTIHFAAVHPPDGPHHAGRIRSLDDDGCAGDEENDQFRFLGTDR
jgi:tight adherence protein B